MRTGRTKEAAAVEVLDFVKNCIGEFCDQPSEKTLELGRAKSHQVDCILQLVPI